MPLWTVYCQEEVVDLMNDRELAELIKLAECREVVDIDVIVDLIRGVVVIE